MYIYLNQFYVFISYYVGKYILSIMHLMPRYNILILITAFELKLN